MVFLPTSQLKNVKNTVLMDYSLTILLIHALLNVLFQHLQMSNKEDANIIVQLVTTKNLFLENVTKFVQMDFMLKTNI